MRSEKLSWEVEIVNEFEPRVTSVLGWTLLLKEEIPIVGGQEGLSIFIQNVTHPLEWKLCCYPAATSFKTWQYIHCVKFFSFFARCWANFIWQAMHFRLCTLVSFKVW